MPKRILLADDSITIQKVVELTFSDGDYEVTAVNNGAKAIQKLSEMRPDIILSDIIMPEKNGYEVCEYVKSHPEFRNIPVILLTGTFEPFDPDRAEKAGSDAVVTKPFESQSLIQRVEELIQKSRNAAPAEAPAADPFGGDAGSGGFAHDNDIFGASAPTASGTDLPFEEPAGAPAFGGETRAFPRMSFDELQAMGNETPAAPSAPAEPSPWDEPAPAYSGETRAFQSMSFDELQAMANETPATPAPTAPPQPPPAPEPSPWDEPPSAPAFGGETRAFPAMSFEDLQKMAAETTQPNVAPASAGETSAPQAASPATPEPAPWDEPAAPPSAPEPAPWEEPAASPAYGGETRAFPRMSFEELEQMAAQTPAAEPAPWEQPAPQPPAAPAWSSAAEAEAPAESYPSPEPVPFVDQEAPFEPEMTAPPMEAAEPAWSPAAAEPEPQATAAAPPAPPPAAAAAVAAPSAEPAQPAASAASAAPAELTEEQIDRIARRVVELMSEQVVKNIAWEVIPDLAEVVVKARIRELEAEA
jgi:CheY-like chemotaxis protein